MLIGKISLALLLAGALVSLPALAQQAPCPVRRAEDFGWESQAIEAQAFAFLGVRSVKGLPLTFPTTTGVAEPMSGGALAWAG